jgi:outer membrane protein insertion porin family
VNGWLRLCTFGLLSALVASFTLPQELQVDSYSGFEGSAVSRIDVALRPGEDEAEVRELIKQEAGKPFSIDAIRQSVSALQQTHKFTQIQVSLEPQASGLRILFLLQPVYYVGLVTFPGAASSMAYTQLLQAVNVSLNSPFVKDQIQGQEQALRKYFATEGYFAADVAASLQIDDVHTLVNISFDCQLHKRAKISSVKIQGVSAEEAKDVQQTLDSFWAKVGLVSMKPGTAYSRKRVDKSLDHLRAHFRKEGRLAPSLHAEPVYDPGTNLAELTLQVDPGPLVSVRIEGARIWSRTLRKLIPIYQENAVDQDLVAEGARNLVSYFQSKSFFDVTVKSQLDRQTDRFEVVYQIDRGGKHRVSSIEFQGNKRFGERQLMAHVSIEKAKFPFNRGKFSQDLIQKSTASLTALYRNEGFPKATVTPYVEDHEPNIDVIFHVDEGNQVHVHDLEIVDGQNEAFRLKFGQRALQLAPGKPYSPHLLQGDRDRILAQYLNRGYPNVHFESTVSPVENDADAVDVVYKIDEGREIRMGQVVLLGTDHTRPQFVRTIAKPNVQEGKPLGEGQLLQSESDLYNLGVFDWVTVTPTGLTENQDQQQVLIRVHETKRNTMDIGGGIEIMPRNGNVPVGAVVVPGLPPISLGDKFTVSQKSFIGPRGTLQFSRHNIRGKAETATIGLVASRLDQRLSFTYADPYLHGSSWASLFSLSTERTTQNPIFTALLQQASFQLERQLNKKRTEKLVAGYSYRRTDLNNIIIPELVLPQDQNVKLSTFYGQFIRDTRDRPLDAHRGQFQTLNCGLTPTGLGSTSSFVRCLAQSSFYKPIRPWLTWANNLRFGAAAGYGDNGYVPLSERFFSGGSDSLRGFPIDGAGPQRPVPVCSNPANISTCTLISVPSGGLMLAIFNSEARFPIPIKENLGGVVFYDGGNVYSNINAHQFISNYSNSVGFGIRYNTKVGPIRLDIGRNLSPVPGVKATQYFVTLGQAF